MDEGEKVKVLYAQLVSSSANAFPAIGKVNVTTSQGVYIIYSSKNEVLHVGKTARAKNGLNQRLTNHLRGQSSFSKQNVLNNGIDLRLSGKFKYIEIENPRIRSFVEALAIGKLCPKHIGTGAK